MKKIVRNAAAFAAFPRYRKFTGWMILFGTFYYLFYGVFLFYYYIWKLIKKGYNKLASAWRCRRNGEL